MIVDINTVDQLTAGLDRPHVFCADCEDFRRVVKGSCCACGNPLPEKEKRSNEEK